MTYRTRRAAVLAAVAVALVSLTAGCGGGGLYSYPLKNVRQVTFGFSTSAGEMLVRNAFVLGPTPGGEIPQGGDAQVFLWLYNGGHRPDRLVGVTAQGAAQSVEVSPSAIPAPPHRIVAIGTSGRQVTLRGLTHPLSGAGNVKLTLLFAEAGKVTFNAPVLARTGPYATLTPAPAATPAVGPTATP